MKEYLTSGDLYSYIKNLNIYDYDYEEDNYADMIKSLLDENGTKICDFDEKTKIEPDPEVDLS